MDTDDFGVNNLFLQKYKILFVIRINLKEMHFIPSLECDIIRCIIQYAFLAIKA